MILSCETGIEYAMTEKKNQLLTVPGKKLMAIPRLKKAASRKSENSPASKSVKIENAGNCITAPLIFVPGIMGSRLFKKGSSEPIWPPVGWRDSRRLKPQSPGDLINAGDIEVSRNEPLFPLVYSELLRYLENMGYILGRNFWIFPYDWTQSNRKSGEQLGEFIRDILSTHIQWHYVDIVNHSMGGFITRAAAGLFSAPVRRAVYIASPHYGSPKAYFILHPEIEFSVFGNFFNNVIGELAWRWYLHQFRWANTKNVEEEIKRMASQMDSVFELLPDRFYLTQQHPLVVKKGLSGDSPVYGLEATYYTEQFRFSSPEMQSRVRRAMAFKEELGAPLPGQENLVIYSDSENTADQIIHTDLMHLRFEQYQDSGQKGDELVPADSASLNHFPGAKRVPGTHNGVPNSQETSLLIRDFLLRQEV